MGRNRNPAPEGAADPYLVYSGDPGATIVADGIYKLLPKNNTGNALDVAACSTADGANVALWTDLNNVCQKWQITYLGDGTYQYLSVNSGKSLDPARCRRPTWPYWYGDCQKWKLVRVG